MIYNDYSFGTHLHLDIFYIIVCHIYCEAISKIVLIFYLGTALAFNRLCCSFVSALHTFEIGIKKQIFYNFDFQILTYIFCFYMFIKQKIYIKFQFTTETK